MKNYKISSVLEILVFFGFGLGLLYYYKDISQYIVAGIKTCGVVIIPALFPFMFLATLLAVTSGGQRLGDLLATFIKVVYRAPHGTELAVTMSWFGGYPSGAKVLGALYEQGKITVDDCKKTLLYCVNSGPAFMVGLVGVGVFGSSWIGVKLFICQLVGSVIIAQVFWWMDKDRYKTKGRRLEVEKIGFTKSGKGGEAGLLTGVVYSVTTTAVALQNICAFVILASCIVGVLKSSGCINVIAKVCGKVFGVSAVVVETFVVGLLEVCSGVYAANNISLGEVMSFLPFLLSFSGLCVMAQVVCCVGSEAVDFHRFLFARVFHGLVTQCLAIFWLKDDLASVSTYAGGSSTVYYDSSTGIMTVLLLLMCCMLFLLIDSVLLKLRNGGGR